MNESWSRRDFLKRSAAAAAGLGIGASAFSAGSYARIQGANDRVHVAVAGVRSRGAEHIGSIGNCTHAFIGHLCDVDSRYLAQAGERVKTLFGALPVMEKDIRILLESKDVDAVTIATPEHWHAPMAILALQAGKHVYVEKPPAHNPAECGMLLRAQKKYGGLVQMGNQQRSSPHTQEIMQKIHEGLIGRPYFCKAWYSNNRTGIGRGREVPVPDYLDWELWQGPAPRRPYRDNVHPYNWHWFWHWGTGETLNNGTHEVDLSLWAMNVTYPGLVSADGGRYHYQDDWEFYDTIVTNYEYGDRMITWEGRSCNNMLYYNRGRGVTIHGTGGTVLIDRNGYEIYDADGNRTAAFEKPERDATTGLGGGGPMTDAHFQNFIDAIRSDQPLNAPIGEGTVSAMMLLLSNIAWKTGRDLHLDADSARILNDNEAMTLWQREYEPGWEPRI
ncbi:Gfo/Idh/MocA family oxidoreductase [bacterium]|nr:Gfo/Idh/MocA family oxidoreductase [bacterium]